MMTVQITCTRLPRTSHHYIWLKQMFLSTADRMVAQSLRLLEIALYSYGDICSDHIKKLIEGKKLQWMNYCSWYRWFYTITYCIQGITELITYQTRNEEFLMESNQRKRAQNYSTARKSSVLKFCSTNKLFTYKLCT